VNPAKWIQFVLPFTVNLIFGTRGRHRARKERTSEYRVKASQTLGFQLATSSTAKIEMPKNMSCLKKIEYVEPDCCSETTLEADKTMTMPSAERKVSDPKIM
jgi:hypothetical protein